MPETHDYHKLGRTTFKAAIGHDNGEYPWMEHPHFPRVESFGARHWPKRGWPDGCAAWSRPEKARC